MIGASSGGVAALLELAAALPADLDAVLGIVLHVGSQYSILPELLSRSGPWPAVHPQSGQALEPGTLYVAPPDHHMLFTSRKVRLSRGPRENHTRPALDPLFRSVALQWRERAVGVVLTGHLDDGTAGLAAIKACGGTAIVQDPATALEPSMPACALANVNVDHCLPLAQIAPTLVRLVGSQPRPPTQPAPVPAREQAIFEGHEPMQNLAEVGQPSALTCPECGGGLWELKDTKPLRYRCHTGHGYSALTLKSAQAEVAEQALWSGVRALQEREMLLRRLANVAEATGDKAQAEVGRRQADRVKAQVQQLEQLVENDLNSA
ncbi:MAG: protein-glutamate methylesterase (protein methylesterase)-like protein [Ramlibacter sp.]|nr:protein-glutamate methylesterase (protein methylesterase)-like protein [Ramlibacter sp.]